MGEKNNCFLFGVLNNIVLSLKNKSQRKNNIMKLIKQETGKKSGPKYIYSIVDENGNVLETRSSNREYVAATICGKFYFGRLDLIGKGDHGRYMKWTKENIVSVSNKPADEIIPQWGNMTNGEFLASEIKTLKNYETIVKL